LHQFQVYHVIIFSCGVPDAFAFQYGGRGGLFGCALGTAFATGRFQIAPDLDNHVNTGSWSGPSRP
jgi:hypothetical protein